MEAAYAGSPPRRKRRRPPPRFAAGDVVTTRGTVKVPNRGLRNRRWLYLLPGCPWTVKAIREPEGRGQPAYVLAVGRDVWCSDRGTAVAVVTALTDAQALADEVERLRGELAAVRAFERSWGCD